MHLCKSINYLSMEDKKYRFIMKKNKGIYWLFTKSDNSFENLEDYNPANKRKVLIVFDDLITDVEANKKLRLIVTELLIRGRKVDISFFYINLISKCLKIYD